MLQTGDEGRRRGCRWKRDRGRHTVALCRSVPINADAESGRCRERPVRKSGRLHVRRSPGSRALPYVATRLAAEFVRRCAHRVDANARPHRRMSRIRPVEQAVRAFGVEMTAAAAASTSLRAAQVLYAVARLCIGPTDLDSPLDLQSEKLGTIFTTRHDKKDARIGPARSNEPTARRSKQRKIRR
jgi:hypothetical protein